MACIAVLRFASIYFECILTSIIFLSIFWRLRSGIEPTISTMPLGGATKIVSGDQPSTVLGDQTNHTIFFLLRKTESLVSRLQSNSTIRFLSHPLKKKSSLIFRYHYTVNTPGSQVFIKLKANKQFNHIRGLYSFCNLPFKKSSHGIFSFTYFWYISSALVLVGD